MTFRLSFQNVCVIFTEIELCSHLCNINWWQFGELSCKLHVRESDLVNLTEGLIQRP